MNNTRFASLLLGLLLLTTDLFAEGITIASGGGYKRPVQEIASLYQKTTGERVAAVFGNMSRIISQANMSGTVSLLIGDRTFFDRSGLEFSNYRPLGRGRLVLAYRKGLDLKAIDDIAGKKITRIGVPDSSKAIYGAAAAAYLHNSGLMKTIENKLLKLTTVPQVSSYLVSGEIDAGFINLTDAKGVETLIGGWFAADSTRYPPISIEAGILKGHENNPGIARFTAFLETPQARAILKKYGLR